MKFRAKSLIWIMGLPRVAYFRKVLRIVELPRLKMAAHQGIPNFSSVRTLIRPIN
jgi:hypothetical protein